MGAEYYVVEGGPVQEAIAEWKHQYKEEHRLRNEWIAAQGAEAKPTYLMANRNGLWSVRWPTGKQPTGWIPDPQHPSPVAGETSYAPNRRTKVGRAVHAEMSKYGLRVNVDTFNKLVHGHDFLFLEQGPNLRFRQMELSILGDVHVLRVPTPDDPNRLPGQPEWDPYEPWPVPEGLRKIELWEFEKMKLDYQQSKQEAAVAS